MKKCTKNPSAVICHFLCGPLRASEDKLLEQIHFVMTTSEKTRVIAIGKGRGGLDLCWEVRKSLNNNREVVMLESVHLHNCRRILQQRGLMGDGVQDLSKTLQNLKSWTTALIGLRRMYRFAFQMHS